MIGKNLKLEWMKQIKILLVVVLCLNFDCIYSNEAVPGSSLSSDARIIKIELEKEMQTIDGFGASDAWRCQMVGKYWPIDKRNKIADLLFSKEYDNLGNPKGIGLSIWRFYLGAGSIEQGENSDISDEWRRGECFLNPDGTYNWNKQEGQRWFLQAAKKRGVERFLAFTISAPVHMTKNGKAFSSQKVFLNIQKDKLPNYADFLIECVVNLQEKEQIKFDYLSPINEPQWDWMAKEGNKASQEGTPATNKELYDFTNLLSNKLKDKSLPTQIVLGEAGAINYLYENVDNENRDNQIEDFWSPSSSMYIGAMSNVLNVISGHSYFSVWPVVDQVEHRLKLKNKLNQFPNLGYWQTEYCVLEQPGETELPGGGGGQRDLGMKTALFVARIIHNDLTIANASSWQWWTALTRADYKDGLIYLDDGYSTGGMAPDYCRKDGYIRESKLLWALGNYSFFIRPNMIRVGVADQNEIESSNDIMISAYKDKETKKIVIVAVNVSENDGVYKLEMSQELVNNELESYITSEEKNLEKSKIKITPEEIVIPAKSVVTYVGKLK